MAEVSVLIASPRPRRDIIRRLTVVFSALHELDPLFREVTLENRHIKQLVRDLKFHHDPVGTWDPPACSYISDGPTS